MADIPDDAPSGPRAAAARLSDQDNASAPIGGSTAAQVERNLFGPMAMRYMPSLPGRSARSGDWHSIDFYIDVHEMRQDACVSLPLEWVMGPLAHGEWEIEARTASEAQFMAQQLQWFWSNALGLVQEEGYAVGSCPGELDYGVQDGWLVQEKFQTFAARDADPLIRDGKPVGIRVRNVEGGHTDLWAWREDVPNKGFWYSHRALHGMRRGRSQIRNAWRPWRRLTGRDGAEDIIDLGVYRHGIGNTIVWHPNMVQTARDGSAPEFAVNGTWHTRDEARHVAESGKGGAGIAIPSETDAKGNKKWDYEIRSTNTNVEQMVGYVEYLERCCSKAIGVPPELFQAAQTGSGYSGRAIPLQAFLVAQQRPFSDITRAWVEQVGLPLLRWNRGPDAWARVTPVPLIESYRKAAWDKPGESSSNVGLPQGATTAPTGGALPPPPQAAGGSVPDVMLSTEPEDLDSFADRLAAMSPAQLAALARQAGIDEADDLGEFE